MRDDVHAFTVGHNIRPGRKPFSVIERQRVTDKRPVAGKRTDTFTSSLRYAIDRRDELRRQGRPAYVEDIDGRRVEVSRWR